MGSGLILLVIVGAWLAVLVPMGLRSHDAEVSSRTGERFGDAVRVLRRRSAVAPLEHEYFSPADDGADPADEESAAPGRQWLPTLRSLFPRGLWRAPVDLLHGARDRWQDHRAHRPAVTPAGRRRRVLVTLVLLAVATWGAGQVGPVWLVDVAGLSAVTALLFLVGCRRQALSRSTRLDADRQPELRRRERAAPAEYAPAEYAPVARPRTEPLPVVETLPVAAPAPARRRVRPAVGAEWQPVPVPLPSYVGKPTAPHRAARLVEAEPWEPAEVDDDQGVFEPRRVVGGW